MLSRYSIGRCVGISRSSVLFSSEWDSDPSGLILASDTAAEVSRWLESWRTVCSVRSAGSCTRTVSGIHIVRCLISTCRLSRVPVEVVRCLHGQQADSKPMIRRERQIRPESNPRRPCRLSETSGYEPSTTIQTDTIAKTGYHAGF